MSPREPHPPPRLGALACAGLFLLLPATGLAQDPALTRAQARYRALDFEGCVATLEESRRLGPAASELVPTELYLGLCHFSMGARAQAVGAFRAALALDPAARLPPYTSPKAVELFEATGLALLREQSALRPAPSAPEPVPSPAFAARPVVPAPARTGRSLLWPSTLGGLGLAGVGTSLAFGLDAQQLEGAANRAHFQSDAEALAAQARPRALVSNIALGVGLTALVGAALLLLVPEGP